MTDMSNNSVFLLAPAKRSLWDYVFSDFKLCEGSLFCLPKMPKNEQHQLHRTTQSAPPVMTIPAFVMDQPTATLSFHHSNTATAFPMSPSQDSYSGRATAPSFIYIVHSNNNNTILHDQQTSATTTATIQMPTSEIAPWHQQHYIMSPILHGGPPVSC
jgi:hypothetical protein